MPHGNNRRKQSKNFTVKIIQNKTQKETKELICFFDYFETWLATVLRKMDQIDTIKVLMIVFLMNRGWP